MSRIETYRRKDVDAYSKLQAFIDEAAAELGVEGASIFELWSSETAQIERLSVLVTRKLTFRDQFNHQAVTVDVEQDTPLRIGTKGIKGQPREVQWKSSEYFSPRQWDWQVVDDQVIEVLVRWVTAPLQPVKVTFSVFGE